MTIEDAENTKAAGNTSHGTIEEVSSEALKQNEQETPEPLGFSEMLSSTLWAVLGVQNSKNRKRDFSRGKAIHFIYFGIGFTIIFVLGMILLVRFILSQVS